MNTQTEKNELVRNVAFIGILMLLLVLGRFQFTLQLIVNVALIFIFAVISYVDWKTHRIPNVLLLPLAALALLLVVLQPESAWLRLGGAVFAFAPFALTALLHPKQLGGGDIKLVTLLGILFGFPNIVWALLVAVLSGGLFALTMLFSGKATRKTELPYAPFLCFGALVILLVLPFHGF